MLTYSQPLGLLQGQFCSNFKALQEFCCLHLHLQKSSKHSGDARPLRREIRYQISITCHEHPRFLYEGWTSVQAFCIALRDAAVRLASQCEKLYWGSRYISNAIGADAGRKWARNEMLHPSFGDGARS